MNPVCSDECYQSIRWHPVKRKLIPGRKIIKARITFMPCVNANETHKLPLLVVGTAQKPRAFKSDNILVYYREQKNA